MCEDVVCMTSTHPRVGMTLLVGIGVKAKVWALARRGAHSFLTMRTVLGIIALCCGDFPFVLKAGREGCLRRFNLVC